MTADNLISTVTPILNGRPFIEGLVRNLVDQECLSFQQIFSDNASSDETWEYLQSVCRYSERLVIHHEPQRLSAHGSWLAGVSLAKTDFVLLMPCDDRLHPKSISLADQILRRNPSVDVICTPVVQSSNPADLSSPPWSPHLSGSFELLSSSSAFDKALSSNFLPWPYSGLILRTQLFLEFLGSKESEQFEGAGDIALSLWLIGKGCTFALRADRLLFAFRHAGQESSRLKNLWLQDYCRLVDYTLSLEGLTDNQRLQACTYFMKALPRHLYLALQDPRQDPRSVASFFSGQYSSLLRRCSLLDPGFKHRLSSVYPWNDLGKRILLAMGERQMVVLSHLVRALSN